MIELNELANNFEKVANDFFKLIADHGLEETKVSMSECRDRRDDHKHLCNTPACHGGWAAIMYKVDNIGSDFFELGAEILAEKLGFDMADGYEVWAFQNPLLWGNSNGNEMFCSMFAFGKEFIDKLTLPDIANHYKGVSERIRKQLEKN